MHTHCEARCETGQARFLQLVLVKKAEEDSESQLRSALTPNPGWRRLEPSWSSSSALTASWKSSYSQIQVLYNILWLMYVHITINLQML